jgi:asparagine synthase (glutamine-hydrolysing)
MCGISGIVSGPAEELSPAIRRINQAMAHRGPDADGFLVEQDIAFGHRRLSILDLSSAANQPFEDASGRYAMVFNGEIYNFAEIKQQLPEYPFRTTGDTEVVLAAYAKWGEAALQLLKGMFALAIWDRKTGSLFLARDRFGVKPLYYYQQGPRLIFASEIRAILASGWVPKKINGAALTDYLKYQSFTAPLTLIENVFQVPAGTSMVFQNGRLEQKTFWDITAQKEETAPATLSEVHAKIKDLLYRSIERRLVSDVPLGAFLSGGIDSSIVVGIMSEIDRSSTNAFTIAFEEKEYNELRYAELVANKFGVDHTSVLLRPSDFLDRLPAALDAMDTPSGDGLNTYVVSGAIKASGITVALSGIGGDELFAGYPIFNQFYKLKKWAGLYDHSRALRRLAALAIPPAGQRRQRMKNLLNATSSNIAAIYPIFRQIQDPRELGRLLRDGKALETRGNTLEKQLIEKQEAIARFDPLSQVSIADYLGYTQSVLLKDADQMGMAVSLEIREPFFDHDLVEYVLNVPDRLKYPDYPKKLLVESLGDLLPKEIVFRKKQGFVLPYDVWLRNDLRKFCEEKIASLASRELFNEEALRGLWQRFLAGNSGIRWADVWIFVVLEHWLEQNQVA